MKTERQQKLAEDPASFLEITGGIEDVDGVHPYYCVKFEFGLLRAEAGAKEAEVYPVGETMSLMVCPASDNPDEGDPVLAAKYVTFLDRSELRERITTAARTLVAELVHFGEVIAVRGTNVVAQEAARSPRAYTIPLASPDPDDSPGEDNL